MVVIVVVIVEFIVIMLNYTNVKKMQILNSLKSPNKNRISSSVRESEQDFPEPEGVRLRHGG